MKKLFLLFAFLGCISITSNAQTCPHAAAAAKTASTQKADANALAAAKLADSDSSIQAKVCSHSGTVSYTKIYKLESGETLSTPVKYDATSNSFVRIEKENAEGGKNAKKSCSEKEAKSCSKGAKGKSCCSKKGAKS